MASDFEIGRVIAVDTAQVTIELNRDIKALARSTYEGAHDVGRINSYVIIPVGARRLVAMVTRVVLAEEAEITADRTMVTLPAARRIMKATLIGTIDGHTFTQGVSLFPVLDSAAHLVTEDDLNTIFDRAPAGERTPAPDRGTPGYCINLGESAVFKGFPIQFDPDAFFGKHAAVLGSTGSGKSCTIAGIIQSILARSDIRRTHFVILDTNGEYQAAFQEAVVRGDKVAPPRRRYLYVPSEPGARERLAIPYWFMNADDFVRLFRASPGVQRPILLDALRLARSPATQEGGLAQAREVIRRELFRIATMADDRGKASAELEDVTRGLIRYLDARNEDATELFGDKVPQLRRELESLAGGAGSYVGEPEGRRFSKPLPVDVQTQGKALAHRWNESLLPEGDPAAQGTSADNPTHFDKAAFQLEHLERAMARDESGGARARDYCATMLMRVYRLIEDRRFEFLFGPVGGQWPPAPGGLAAFMRDVLGLPARAGCLADTSLVPEGLLPFYDRQRRSIEGHDVTIVDLSLLAAEVLENVTALLGRLVLEFLQRMGEFGGEKARGSLPVVLVLEEAQNYIREQRLGEEESISRAVFERIAREGRKFGLGLVVASQRPSELSKTVLSQCSTFVVHRLQNPEDLRYFKDVVPGVYGALLDQLPALAPRTALVLGAGVRAPALVRVREARPIPRSQDPKFFQYWVREQPQEIDVEAVCAAWEGRAATQGNAAATDPEDGGGVRNTEDG